MDNSQIILQVIVALIGGGIAGGIVSHFSERKLKAYELKLAKYLEFGGILAQMPVSGIDAVGKKVLNEALIFGSDEVSTEVLKLIRLIASREKNKTVVKTEDGEDALLVAEDLKPLLLAIRNDQGLCSCQLKLQKLRFFG